LRGFPEHGQSVFQRESIFLVRVDADGDSEAVKKLHTLFDHPQVPNREPIEAACVNTQSFGLSNSITKG
jgi:hypothetical protein